MDYGNNGRFGGREKTGFRFQSWSSTDGDGIDRWNKSPLLNNKAEVRQDHVCKPVLIGSDGKVIPAVFEYPPHAQKDGVRRGGLGGWDQSGDAFRYDAYKGDGKWDPSGDAFKFDAYKPQAFISNVQTAASAADARLGIPQGSTFHRQKADYGIYYGVDGDAKGGNGWGSEGYGAYNNSGWGSRLEPKAAEKKKAWGGSTNWLGGRRSEWGGPAEGELGRATNVIEAATETLREFARPEAAGDAFVPSKPWKFQSPTAGANQPSKKSSTANVIDSKEAAKKYGGEFIW